MLGSAKRGWGVVSARWLQDNGSQREDQTEPSHCAAQWKTGTRLPDPRTKPSIDDPEEHLTGHVFIHVLVELLIGHNASLILGQVIGLNKMNE